MADSDPQSSGAPTTSESRDAGHSSSASSTAPDSSTPPTSSNNTSTASDPPTLSSTAVQSVPSSATPQADTATPGAPSSTSLTSRLLGIPDSLKVIVHFRAVGDAPQLKKSKFMLSASYRFIVLIDFLRKHLHYKPTDTLFLFCNASFSPSPDALIYDLFQCFQLNNELVINYATQDAWG